MMNGPAGAVTGILPTERPARASIDFRAIVEASMQGITIQDHHRICYVNPACARIFGYDSPNQLVGESWDRLVAAENLGMLQDRVDASARGETIELNGGWQGVRRDGSRIWLDCTLTPFLWEGRPAVLCFLTDITHRRSLEDQFRQAQKMQTMGRLAGGVAHDFNNLLTVIMGYAEIMRNALGRDDPLASFLEEIHRAGERASHLTRQLLAFSRKRVSQPVTTDLNGILAGIEKILIRLIGEDVRLALKTDPALWKVKADPGQIEQIVMNLAVNARDAMPHGGSLIIETLNADLPDARAATQADGPPQPYVMLAVSDTGCGMDAVTRARLFEPFFTTKEPEKGTGLGLSTIAAIVKQSGGRIHVFSEPGLGTTFKVFLPRDPDAASKADVAAVMLCPPTGTETLLLVEDDSNVRALARTILVRQGYTVLQAEDGANALKICAAHEGPIDLLISDVVLPNLGGGRLADQLRTRYPRLRVLFLSGYTDDAIVHHGVLDRAGAFIQKPFLPDALARKVREALDEQTAALP